MRASVNRPSFGPAARDQWGKGLLPCGESPQVKAFRHPDPRRAFSAVLLGLVCLAGTSPAAGTEEPKGCYRYDFGDAKAAPAAGYVRLGIDDVYHKDRGCGVVHSQGRHERGWRRRGRQKDPRLDTFIFDGGGLTCVQDLPDGAYVISLASGDATYDGAASVRINGQQVVQLTETLPGRFVVLAAHQVKVAGGQLRVEIGGYGRLSYLEIVPHRLAEELGMEGSADPARTVKLIGGTPAQRPPNRKRPNVDPILPVEDLDGDGKYECVLSHWAATYCIDAETGRTKWKAELATGGEPGPGSWDYPMVVGHFADAERFAVAVRAGLKVHCFGADGKPLWTRQLEGQTYGHELDRYDVDGDGYHEIFIGRNRNVTALTHDGKLLWEDTTQQNHTDFFVFGDVDADGRCEVIYDHDGCGGRGPLYVADALTGRRERTADYRSAGLQHAQAMTCGDFRPDLPGLEFACTDKLHFLILFDAQGEVLWKRDVPTSLLSRADWDGDGAPDLLNFTVAVNVDGAFSVWNGQGKRLYAISWLPSPVRSHATGCGPALGFDGFADLDGNGRADVPVAFGPWAFGVRQNLFLMEAPGSPEPP